MPATPGVGIVVVTYNSQAVVAELLRSLPAASRDVAYELVVVDNDSSDATRAVVRASEQNAELIHMSGNRGYAAAVNAGCALMDDELPVLVCNADVRLHPGAVPALLRAADSAPDIGVVVPRLVDETGDPLPSLRRDPAIHRAVVESVVGGRLAGRVGLGELVTDPGSYAHGWSPDWASGAVMLLSPAARRSIGRWDESFFLYSEETDVALRARDAGLRLWFEPTAAATHLGGQAHRSPRLWSLLVWNRLRLYRRRHGRVAGGIFRLALLLGETIRAASGAATHRAGVLTLLRDRPAAHPHPGAPSTRTGRPRRVGAP